MLCGCGPNGFSIHKRLCTASNVCFCLKYSIGVLKVCKIFKGNSVPKVPKETILPHLVTTNEFGVKSVNYQGITAYLIEAFKEIDTRIQNLEKK